MTDNLDTTVRSQMIDLPAGRFHYVSWGAERAELPSVLSRADRAFLGWSYGDRAGKWSLVPEACAPHLSSDP